MTRRITLITTVLGAAVLAAPAAFGKGEPVTYPPDALERAVGSSITSEPGIGGHGDAFERAVLAREQSSRLSATVSPDAFERAAVQSQRSHDALMARSEALNRRYGLGVAGPQDAFERAAQASQNVQWRRALEVRGEGLNQRYATPISDSHDRVVPTRDVPTPVSGSGREVDWPQLGIGFAVGLLMALGLLLGLRLTGTRPLAH